ncbi:hypothetical protein [Natronolimnobius baerhuensis]|uniref:hypothetical protein n=1 Tax=Natronolimnobius baerhuensis TaxID=253108 RepID=UPI001595395A|nr:hypothetical protein [Natronolimnobius baerhuensis]
MNERRIQLMYVIGMILSGAALISAAMAGDTLFAITFGVIIVYLVIRYWMVSSGKF